MLSKNEVKYIQSLCHKKSRDEEGVFIAEGPKLAEELLAGNFEIVKVFGLSNWLERNNEKQVATIEVTPDELQKISNLKTANEVLVIARQKVLENEPVTSNNITLVVDTLQDPGNMGTIIRIADWFGITQIIASENSVELYNPKVVQATMGSICRVNVWYKNIQDFLSNVKVPVFGALLKGQSIYEIAKPAECILVIGNESKGIGDDILSLISNPVTIPRFGGAESLNAAVATGIILSHLRGQSKV